MWTLRSILFEEFLLANNSVLTQKLSTLPEVVSVTLQHESQNRMWRKASDFVELCDWRGGRVLRCMETWGQARPMTHRSERRIRRGGRQPERNSKCHRLAIPVSLLYSVSASNLLISSWFVTRNRPRRAENTKLPHRHSLSCCQQRCDSLVQDLFFSPPLQLRPDIMVEWLVRLLHIPVVSGSNLNQDTGYLLRFPVDFLSLSRKMPWQCLKLSYDYFLPISFMIKISQVDFCVLGVIVVF
jgi:hypothetical protein